MENEAALPNTNAKYRAPPRAAQVRVRIQKPKSIAEVPLISYIFHNT